MKFLKLFFVLGFLAFPKAQDASYFLMGISKNFKKKHRFTARSGYSIIDHSHTLRLQQNFRLNKTFSIPIEYNLNTKYKSIYKSIHKTENQILIGLNLEFPISKNKKWKISDRNSYFLKEFKTRDDMHLYRNRLGISYLTYFENIPSQFFAQNEIFIDFNKFHFWRNQFTLGYEMTFENIVPQITYHYQDNSTNADRHLVSLSIVFLM